MEIAIMVILYLWLFRVVWDNFLVDFINYFLRIAGRDELPKIKQPKKK